MKNVLCTVTICGLLTLAGCGTQRAIDSTNSIPDKLDTTNNKMDGMSGKLDTTNGSMTTLSGKIDTTNATVGGMSGKLDTTNSTVAGMSGKLDTTNSTVAGMSGKLDTTNSTVASMGSKLDTTNSTIGDMSKKLDKTNEATTALGQKMDTTNAAIHDQALGVAWDTMTKSENTKYVATGLPLDMIPAGQIFADVATSLEILKLIHVTMGSVVANRPATPMTDESGKACDSMCPYPANVIANVDFEKKTKFSALEVISGLVSDDKVDEIIKTQLNAGGLYQDEAKQFMAFRFNFISDTELKKDLENSGDPTHPVFSDPGKIAQALALIKSLIKITTLPNSEQDFVVGTNQPSDSDPSGYNPSSGMLDGNDAIPTQAVHNGIPSQQLKMLQKAFDTDLDPKYKDPHGPFVSMVNDLKAQVDATLQSLPPPPSLGIVSPLAMNKLIRNTSAR